MKTSSIILIISFAVGISILSVIVIQNPPKNGVGDNILDDEQKTYFQKYWNDRIKLYPNEYVISEKKEITHSYNEGDPLIEINGLKSKYAADEPINFEILAIGDGNGCLSFGVTIRGEDENAPPVYSQGYVSSCEISKKYVGIPLYFAINSENNQITNLESGKYEIMADYYQDRGSYGDVKQEFTITNSSENNIDSSSTSETPESLLAQFEILANENTRLQDARTLKMQELGTARANKSNSISTLEAELDVINERLKQNGIKLDQIRTVTSKFYEIDPQLKATLEKARQILTDNHDLIPWNGLGIDPKSKTLLIEFESSYLADKYTPLIKKLIGEDIPITVFVGKNTFD